MANERRTEGVTRSLDRVYRLGTGRKHGGGIGLLENDMGWGVGVLEDGVGLVSYR